VIANTHDRSDASANRHRQRQRNRARFRETPECTRTPLHATRTRRDDGTTGRRRSETTTRRDNDTARRRHSDTTTRREQVDTTLRSDPIPAHMSEFPQSGLLPFMSQLLAIQLVASSLLRVVDGTEKLNEAWVRL
jgi:hypothetical protein